MEMQKYWRKMKRNLKKWNNFLCREMTCKKNAKRDFLIVSMAMFLALTVLIANRYVLREQRIQNNQAKAVAQAAVQEILGQVALEKFEEENVSEISAIQEKFDVTSWKNYKSSWYGFAIKYPENWKTPVVAPRKQGSVSDYRVSFLANIQEDKNFVGFEVAVYDLDKVKELFATDEFPKKKENLLENTNEQCETIDGHLIETGDYAAEEIYIPQTDDCYESTLFFSVTDGRYIYNMVPILKKGFEFHGDPLVGASDDVPEFFVAISQFENVEIVRPKPKPVQPKITAPFPLSFKKDDLGRLVCAKKNDKPSKSKKTKNKHLDMECCLDPDEYPNPHCYYPIEKYGKYLK
jgi:hypothetical protein